MMERIAAGAFVGFVLVVASDFDPTAPIAVGFAYLILLSTLMVVGPSAFKNVSDLVAPRIATTQTAATAGNPGRARGGTW